ncbi:MAG: hypothetical protein A2046_15585 [Bacteroidetes bacterium GWA2_30_7]|nr:MAG: hypothetical protein A2046_15585 [Bacteroidetes bacterium GWA2_30_7]
MDENTLIVSLKQKINKLISLYEFKKDEITKLKNELIEKNNQLDSCENKINELELKNNQLKLAKALVNNDEPNDAKLRINKMVREIDKCIALLNK